MKLLPGCYIDGAYGRSEREECDVLFALLDDDTARELLAREEDAMRESWKDAHKEPPDTDSEEWEEFEEEWEWWGELRDELIDTINDALEGQYIGFNPDDPGTVCVWDDDDENNPCND